MKLTETGTGNVHHETGLFDECLSDDDAPPPSIEAKYCTVFFDRKPKRIENNQPIVRRRRPSVANQMNNNKNDDLASLFLLSAAAAYSAAANNKVKVPNDSTTTKYDRDDEAGQPIENMSNFVKSSAAFCIPSSCSAEDLRSAVAHRLRHFSLVSITSEDFCYTRDKIKADSKFGIGGIFTWYVVTSLT